MKVIIQIQGREAIPVRSIPLLTDWETMTPDGLAHAMAGDDHYFHFDEMHAYRFEGGNAVQKRWWQANVILPLNAMSDNIRTAETTHEAGLQEWRTESLRRLPAGVYVWRDEFEPGHQRHYGKPSLPLDHECKEYQLTVVESAKLTAEHQERIALDYAPFITDELRALVMDGFPSGAELIAPSAKCPAAPAPVQNTATPAPVGATVEMPKQRAQEVRILELLAMQGHDPLKLAQRAPGKPGPKAEIRTLAMTEPAFFTTSSFDKAWERLRSDGAVAGAE